MIPNVTRGGNTRGVLLYLVGAGKREEHQDPHLVAGAPETLRIAGERLLDRSLTPATSLASWTSRASGSVRGWRSPSATVRGA